MLGAPSRIEQLIFSEDGHWLAFGSDSGDVSVAEMAPQGPLDSFAAQSHRGSIRFLDFGPHGRSLISKSYNRLRLTPLEIPKLLKLADERTGRNFQGLEWDTYFHSQAYRTTFRRLPSLAGKGAP